MSAPLLLLVEDSPEDVLFFKKAVAQTGMQCLLEVDSDGQQAIERLSACDRNGGRSAPRCPSHVILDLKMPRVSGLEVLAWIRANPLFRETPVMILTSSQLAADVGKATDLGIDAFLVKPVSFKGLLEVVRGIADRWKIPMKLE